MMREAIKQYYLSRFGEPNREAEFVPPLGPKIEIWKWDATQSGEGVCIYATIGASEALTAPTEKCELFLGIIPNVDEVATAIAEVALHGNGIGNIPQPGDTVTLAYPLWDGTSMRTFLFTSGERLLNSMMCENHTIRFVQLVPIFFEELEFKKKCGEAALWAAFERQVVPYWNADREKARLS